MDKPSAKMGALTLMLLLTAPAVPRETESLGTSTQELKVPPTKPIPPRPSTVCKQGYVWREARPSDRVCVTPETRTEVARQNREAPRRWVNGAYGRHTCIQGFVWREAFQGDDVCVEPQVRDDTRRDNQLAAQRRAEAPPAKEVGNRPRWSTHNFAAPNGGLVAYTIMPGGNPACASYDARNCLWGVRYEQVDFGRLKPLVCGEAHRAKWGVTGYEDPKHWCSVARRIQ
jgi:hypothetical protein